MNCKQVGHLRLVLFEKLLYLSALLSFLVSADPLSIVSLNLQLFMVFMRIVHKYNSWQEFGAVRAKMSENGTLVWSMVECWPICVCDVQGRVTLDLRYHFTCSTAQSVVFMYCACGFMQLQWGWAKMVMRCLGRWCQCGGWVTCTVTFHSTYSTISLARRFDHLYLFLIQVALFLEWRAWKKVWF